MLSNADENFRHFIRQIKVPEEGCKGETGTVRVSPAKKMFPATRHRRLAGRDPTANPLVVRRTKFFMPRKPYVVIKAAA